LLYVDSVLLRFCKGKGLAVLWQGPVRTYRKEQGSLLVGNPEEVVEKVLLQSKELGGISRLTFQLDLAEAAMPREKLFVSIDLIGKEVNPALRAEVAVRS